jgi:2',3'-cyclic-nucleotide 2'-phosphodiesterase/3'-nucleotidase
MPAHCFGLLGLLALPFPLGAQAAAPDTAHLVIVATTDVHGRATDFDYEADREAPWGLTRAATAVDSLRRAFPGSVILVDAGDLLQGNPLATYAAAVRRLDPNPMIDALNYLGYDAATPGNHDFDFGLEVFGKVVDAATFGYVSGNVYRLPEGVPALQPGVLVRRNGVTVGITGFTTPGVMLWDRSQLGGRLEVRRILASAPGAMAALSKADLVVAVVHSGLSGPSSYDTTGIGPENVAAELAGLSAKPHLVIVGHSHREIRDTVIEGVHFVQPAPWARGLAAVHVWLVRERAGERWRVVGVRADAVPLGKVPPDPGLVRRLQAVHQEVRNWVAEPLAQTEESWSARYARVEDTPILDFVNEVQRRVTGAQLSATAAFNLDAGFGPGAVRLRDIAALYPYENTLKAVRIDGATLLRYLERSAAYFRTYSPEGPLINDSVAGFNYDVVSGVSYVIDLSRPVGSRILQLAYQGRLVQPTDTFTLALNSYRQAGGGGFDMLRGLPVVYDGQESVRDLLTEAVRRAGVLRAADYFRDSWRILPPEARERLRQVVSGGR